MAFEDWSYILYKFLERIDSQRTPYEGENRYCMEFKISDFNIEFKTKKDGETFFIIDVSSLFPPRPGKTTFYSGPRRLLVDNDTGNAALVFWETSNNTLNYYDTGSKKLIRKIFKGNDFLKIFEYSKLFTISNDIQTNEPIDYYEPW